MVPSTVVMPRVGSFALASFGRIRKVQEPPFAPLAAGRKSLALKRIFEAVLVISARYQYECAFWMFRRSLAQ
jgi:hypothetical protein